MRIYTYQQPSKPIHSPKQPDEEIQSSALEGLLYTRNLKNLTENSLDIVKEKLTLQTFSKAKAIEFLFKAKMFFYGIDLHTVETEN